MYLFAISRYSYIFCPFTDPFTFLSLRYRAHQCKQTEHEDKTKMDYVYLTLQNEKNEEKLKKKERKISLQIELLQFIG